MFGLETPPRYHCYVLRYQQTSAAAPESGSAWRFCLEEPDTGLRHLFASEQALLAFLSGVLEQEQDRRCTDPTHSTLLR